MARLWTLPPVSCLSHSAAELQPGAAWSAGCLQPDGHERAPGRRGHPPWTAADHATLDHHECFKQISHL